MLDYETSGFEALGSQRRFLARHMSSVEVIFCASGVPIALVCRIETATEGFLRKRIESKGCHSHGR